MHSNIHNKLDKAMTAEQFTQVVDAILAGKYSWACVLILRYAGYNPLHYIPYRTYNRLMKENCQNQGKRAGDYSTSMNHNCVSALTAHKDSHRIPDLDYREIVNDKSTKLRGGESSLPWIDIYPQPEIDDYRVKTLFWR